MAVDEYATGLFHLFLVAVYVVVLTSPLTSLMEDQYGVVKGRQMISHACAHEDVICEHMCMQRNSTGTMDV